MNNTQNISLYKMKMMLTNAVASSGKSIERGMSDNTRDISLYNLAMMISKVATRTTLLLVSVKIRPTINSLDLFTDTFETYGIQRSLNLIYRILLRYDQVCHNTS